VALVFAREQRTLLAHRKNFIGRSVSFNTVSWNYNGRTWTVERPADGEPPRRQSVDCPVCGKPLTYTVYSLAATKRRRKHRWLAVLGCLLVMFPLCGLMAVDPSSAFWLTFGLLSGVAAFVTAWSLGFVAGGERGLAGHGSAMPIYAKHKLFLPNAENGSWM
jgi:hypothetical protein